MCFQWYLSATTLNAWETLLNDPAIRTIVSYVTGSCRVATAHPSGKNARFQCDKMYPAVIHTVHIMHALWVTVSDKTPTQSCNDYVCKYWLPDCGRSYYYAGIICLPHRLKSVAALLAKFECSNARLFDKVISIQKYTIAYLQWISAKDVILSIKRLCRLIYNIAACVKISLISSQHTWMYRVGQKTAPLLADRTATQYDRLLASSCRLSVCL